MGVIVFILFILSFIIFEIYWLRRYTTFNHTEVFTRFKSKQSFSVFNNISHNKRHRLNQSQPKHFNHLNNLSNAVREDLSQQHSNGHKDRDLHQESHDFSYPTSLLVDQWIERIKEVRPEGTDVLSRSNQSDEQLFDGLIKDLELIKSAHWEQINLSPIELEQLQITMYWLNHYDELERPELMRLKNNLDRLQQKIYYFQHQDTSENEVFAQQNLSAYFTKDEQQKQKMMNQKSVRKTSDSNLKKFKRNNRRELIRAYEILSPPISIRKRQK
ncbi:hypothetical protein [Atopobacter phocae]|uniref:hypothetical protein n=1 Tax=Atopobacter phocae TaxID=136492 RepID=UPI00046FFF9B|nr:hypothetical protein [Atopobacter phocae]